MRVRRAACLILPVRLEEVFACEEATRAGDPEAGVHDMRVAMKRLREGLRLFRKVYPQPALEPFLTRVETLNDALGQVRDRDVTQAHLLDLLNGEKPSAGLRALLARLSAERDAAFSELITLLDQLAAENFPPDLRAFIADGRRPRSHAVAGERLRPFAHARIARQLRDLGHRLPAVADESDAAGLHRARIVEKKLRYRLEPFLTVLDKPVQKAYPTICQLHDALGDVHDCDVLLPLLTQHTDAVPRLQQGPLHRLTARLEVRRHERYVQLTELLNGRADKALADLEQAVR
jgi:CHAD domain-containing protein